MIPSNHAGGGLHNANEKNENVTQDFKSIQVEMLQTNCLTNVGAIEGHLDLSALGQLAISEGVRTETTSAKSTSRSSWVNQFSVLVQNIPSPGLQSKTTSEHPRSRTVSSGNEEDTCNLAPLGRLDDSLEFGENLTAALQVDAPLLGKAVIDDTDLNLSNTEFAPKQQRQVSINDGLLDSELPPSTSLNSSVVSSAALGEW